MKLALSVPLLGGALFSPVSGRGEVELFVEGFTEIAAGVKTDHCGYFGDSAVGAGDHFGGFFDAGGIDEPEGGGGGHGF